MAIFARFLRVFLSMQVVLVAVLGLGSELKAQSGSNSGANVPPQLLPYTSRLIAGGGPAATYTVGGKCPVSGFTETDTYGDGCLANEIVLVSARFAIVDTGGNVFFSDYTNGLVRRVDAVTGVVTAIAGGATASPAANAVCGALKSTDALGDGCLSNAVKLKNPTGLAFDGNGNLYFADNGLDQVREVLATNKLVTSPGVISLVAGNVTTYGYNVNNTAASGAVNAATQSYLNFPYGLAFDSVGNLYIADEGNNAIEVVNLTGGSETVQGLTVPAGTIAKVVGYGSLNAASARTGDCPDFISTASKSRGGCYYAATFTGTTGVTANINGGYGIAIDQANNLYFSNEFETNDGVVLPNNNIYNFAGEAATPAVPGANVTTRAPAGTFAIGSSFGIAADTASNVYIPDASSGIIWRVDGPLNATTTAKQPMYAVAGGVGAAGGPTAVCVSATDTNGDGCPALQAKIGSSGSVKTGFASTSGLGPGIYGLSVDAYADLFFGDTETALIREIASGTQFGPVGANQPVDTVEIHFPAGDGPSTTVAPYTVSSGATNFSLGTATCTTNSDKTVDCLLPITATPTVLGPFSGNLQVTAQFGGTSNFPLNGTYIQSPITRTSLSYTAASSCTGTTTYSTSTAITLTAKLTANGPAPPIGSADNITFYANNGTTNTAIGTVPVANSGTNSAPVYGAVLTYTFATPGTYTLTAVYSGDSYFKPSTGTAPSTVSSATPTFAASAVNYQQSTVTAGQTALYSFNLSLAVYTGTVTFSCSGLPSNSSCVFSPLTLTGTGCSTTAGTPYVVAVSILTHGSTALTASIGAGGSGPWQAIAVLLGLGMALLIGLNRRRLSMRSAQFWMALALLVTSSGLIACGNGTIYPAATPSGSYTVTVTASGTTGAPSLVPLPLIVK